MDLGRWSFRKLGTLLGDALDGNIEVAPPDEVREAFDVSEDTERLDRDLAVLRAGSAPEKILNAFMPYFEGGLALKIQDGETLLTSMFLFGQTFAPPDAGGTAITLGFREMESGRVYRSTMKPILTSLGLDSFFRLDGAAAFAFKVSKEMIFVLFDNRPHPWQVFAIENAYLSARDTAQRLSVSKPAVSSRGFFK